MTKRIYISQFETPLATHGTIEFRCKCGGKSVLGHDAHGWYVTGDGKVTVKPSKKERGVGGYDFSALPFVFENYRERSGGSESCAAGLTDGLPLLNPEAPPDPRQV